MNYTITSSEPASAREAILELWRRNLPDASADRYPWLYESGLATGFVLRATGGKPVGAAGLMRRDFLAFGQLLQAGQAIDLNVDPEHRTVGPALGLQRAVVGVVDSGALGMAYAFPNQRSEPVLRRIGYRPLGDLQRWVKILSCRAVFRHWGWPNWLARSASAFADPFLPRRRAARRDRLAPGIRVAEVDSFDDRFDSLWRRAASQFPILGQRDSAYLTWRFSRCPDQRYRALVLAEPDGELVGYAVFGRREEAMHLADLLVADPRQLDRLMAEFLRLARREGAETAVMLYCGSPTVCDALRRFGFWQRPSGRKAMVYEKDRELPDAASRPDAWHLTGADIDTDG